MLLAMSKEKEWCLSRQKSNPETGVGQTTVNTIQRSKQMGNPTDRL